MAYEDRDESVVVVDRGAGAGSQIAAFLMGLAAGAGIALLFAPQSGAKTRADIARQTKRARRVAERMARDARDRALDVYDTARDEVGRRTRDARRGIGHAIDEVKDRVDAGKEAGRAAAKAAREELQRRLADSRTNADGSDA